MSRAIESGEREAEGLSVPGGYTLRLGNDSFVGECVI